jgi:adenylate kinase
MIVTMQIPRHGSVGYQHARTRVSLTKRDKFLQMQPRTQARIRKNATKTIDECIAHECGVLQTVKQQNYS